MAGRYEAVSRSGAFARFRVYRAVVRAADSEQALVVKSLELASQIAELLNAADLKQLPPRVRSESPFKHYECVEGPPGTFRVIRGEGAFIEPVARTTDAELARAVADLLDRVDPAKKVRVRRIGWW